MELIDTLGLIGIWATGGIVAFVAGRWTVRYFRRVWSSAKAMANDAGGE